MYAHIRAFALAALLAVAACTSSDGGGAGGAAPTAPTVRATDASTPSPSTASTPGFGRIEASVVAVFAGKVTGSGLVYSQEGTIVTAAHLLGTAKTVQVGFADGTRSAATVVAKDPISDLAVLRVSRGNLLAAELDAAMPPPGAPVHALGSPLTVDAQVRAGVVGGVEWSVPGAGKVERAVVGLVPVDATVGAAHAGGPVLDADGEVVGLAEVFPGEHGAGYLFVVPAVTVVRTVEALLEAGKVRHVTFGAVAAPVTLALSQALDLGVNDGALLREVTPNSPAAKAGLKPGDVVTTVNGARVRSSADFLDALRALTPGDKVALEVHRGGAGKTVTVTLSELRR